MGRKTIKTLCYEICASLLVAAALAGFNLVASEKPTPEIVDGDNLNPVLMAHGRGGQRGGGHGRGRRHHGGMAHHQRPHQGQKDRLREAGHGRQSNDALTPVPPSATPAVQPTPTTQPPSNEPPAIR